MNCLPVAVSLASFENGSQAGQRGLFWVLVLRMSGLDLINFLIKHCEMYSVHIVSLFPVSVWYRF